MNYSIEEKYRKGIMPINLPRKILFSQQITIDFKNRLYKICGREWKPLKKYKPKISLSQRNLDDFCY